jgi:hypothetical protein
VTTPTNHVFEFVELKAGDDVIAEGAPTGDKPLFGAETQSMSLADVFRSIQPHEPVPQAILDADSRTAAVRQSGVQAVRGKAPEGPTPTADAPRPYDNFWNAFCAPSDNVNCFEGRTGTLTGSVVFGSWFQTAGMLDPNSPAGTFGTLDLNEWVCGSQCVWETVFGHLILPGQTWYLTRTVLPPAWHYGVLYAPSNAMTSFAEQSDQPSITAWPVGINEFDFTVRNFWGVSDIKIYTDNLPYPNISSREVTIGGPVVNGTFTGTSGILDCNPGYSNPGQNPITIRAVSEDGSETAYLYNYVQGGCY